MYLIKICGVLFSCITTLSCKKENKTNKDIKINLVETPKQPKKENRLIIKENGVLNLYLNDNIPSNLANYKLIKSIKIAEEGIEEPVINLLENGKELLQISLKYDKEKEKYTNKIGEILIKTSIFKTKEKIGIDSTLEDFINTYPRYSIWYSYVSGNFILESEKSKIQFILDNKGYKGKKDLMESDLVILKLEDFSISTKIKTIRIF